MTPDKKPSLALIFSSDFETWPTGGMLSFILEIIPRLKEHFNVELWGARVDKQPPKTTVVIAGEKYPLYQFYTAKTKNKILPNIFKAVLGIRKHRRLLLSKNYDVIYFHGVPLVVGLGRIKNNKPSIVLHFHGTYLPLPFPLKQIYKIIQRIALDYSNLCLVSALENDFKKFLEQNTIKPENSMKIIRVNNFADEITFKPTEEKSKKYTSKNKYPTLIWVGRLDKVKDPEFAIKSFHEFHKWFNKEAQLFVVGGGKLFEKCQKLAKKLAIEKNVIFLGNVTRDNIPRLMSSADLLIFTSHIEGIPITLIEAFLCGLPVVACDARGVTGLVEHNINGVIVKEREPKIFAEAIAHALSNLESFRENILLEREKYSSQRATEFIIKKIKETIVST